jgi:hypothetical protein
MLKNIKSSFLKAPNYVQLALAGGGIYLLYKTYKILFKNEQEQTNIKIQTETKKELDAAIKKAKLSYPLSQYSAWANIIYNSTMYGLGDNYGAVKQVLLLMKNDADVLKLVQEYGSRQNYVFGIPQGEKRDLFTNLRAELGDEYFGLYTGKLNDINADWTKKKISYKI